MQLTHSYKKAVAVIKHIINKLANKSPKPTTQKDLDTFKGNGEEDFYSQN